MPENPSNMKSYQTGIIELINKHQPSWHKSSEPYSGTGIKHYRRDRSLCI